MQIPDILKGEPHLPLKESTTSEEAILLSNGFYGTSLTQDDFCSTQAFWSSTGFLNLELINKETSEVAVLFINKNSFTETKPPVDPDEDEWIIDNPIFESEKYTPYLTPPLLVAFPGELDFLNELGQGPVKYPVTGNDNTLAHKLSTLLNSYSVLGRWTSGTIGVNCTGGFELVFKGKSTDAPEEFYTSPSEQIAILKTHHGESIGYLCLLT